MNDSPEDRLAAAVRGFSLVKLQMRGDLATVTRTTPLGEIAVDDVLSTDDVSKFIAGAEGYLAALDPSATEALENFAKVLEFVSGKTTIRKTSNLDFYES